MLALSFREGESVLVGKDYVTIEQIDRRRRRVLIATPYEAKYVQFDEVELKPGGIFVCVTRLKSGTVVTLGFHTVDFVEIKRRVEVVADVCSSPEISVGDEPI